MMVSAPIAPASAQISLLNIWFDIDKCQLVIGVSLWAVAGLVVLIVLVLFQPRQRWWGFKSLTLDRAEFGMGAGRVTLSPNYTDRQVAYQVWVEMSTRKIGLPIDLDDDVIAEIYDSWHSFFGVTRDLVKSIPVNRVSDKCTKEIIDLSIEILNGGIRPHLTKWQARFRTWYEDKQKAPGAVYEEPQELQKRYPDFFALKDDMLSINDKLIAYRETMRKLVYG
jgi:hypothetical protein